MQKWAVTAMLWLVLSLLWIPGTVAQGTPEGTMTWGVHVTLAPTWFDPAGEITPNPPFYPFAEATANFLTAVGIKVKVRTMERAAFFTSWREKKLNNLILGVSGAFGNAATRIEAFTVTGGHYAYGGYADIDELFARQTVERDRQKRAELLSQIQSLMYDKVMYAPLFDPAFICASGPRVEVSGLGMIPQFAYSGPYEDLQLKKP
jgi:peptide/nickel transport system substrate-binding protein